MGLIGCPETSVINYHHSLSNNPEERSSQVLKSGEGSDQWWHICDACWDDTRLGISASRA